MGQPPLQALRAGLPPVQKAAQLGDQATGGEQQRARLLHLGRQFQARSRGLNQALANVGDAKSVLGVAEGGLNAIAIPERVDFTRKIGNDRQATLRVNLAAIMNRAEPDLFIRRDDHIHIGTNFWAAPLAVIRNGFRMTYGFGFLLDRNFGNDVFGPPPFAGFNN